MRSKRSETQNFQRRPARLPLFGELLVFAAAMIGVFLLASGLAEHPGRLRIIVESMMIAPLAVLLVARRHRMTG